MEPLSPPTVDPTPIFEHFRGCYATELLTAAVAHFKVFDVLSAPLAFEELRSRLGLEERPAVVLITALRAMGLIEKREGNIALSSCPEIIPFVLARAGWCN